MCAILYAVKVTERQMRWVKLSGIEYFPLLRAPRRPLLSERAIFLPTPSSPEAGRR